MRLVTTLTSRKNLYSCCNVAIAGTSSKKIRAVILSMKFISPEVGL